jgi:hypothetical protein
MVQALAVGLAFAAGLVSFIDHADERPGGAL